MSSKYAFTEPTEDMFKPSSKPGQGPQGAPVLSNTMKETKKWYEHFTLMNLPAPPTAAQQQDWISSADYKKQLKQNQKSPAQPIGESVEALRKVGIQTLTTLAAKEAAHKSNQMTSAWVQKMLNGGTIVDKISALSLQMKYQQLTTGQHIESLLALCQRRSANKESNLAIETLRDLYLVDLMPKGRKLKFFHQQPWIIAYQNYTSNPLTSPIPPLHQFRQRPKDDVLALFVLEDVIKKSYGKFIEILEQQTQAENFQHIKRHRIDVIFNLLSKHPEQENLLLAILINKFSDRDRTIASKVQTLLNTLIHKCPGMKLSIVKEIEQRVIFKPYIKQRTQYYGILFLTNLTILQSEQYLAQYLLTLYLTIFQVVINDTIPMINDKKLAHQAFLDKYSNVINADKRHGHKDGKSKQALKKKAKTLEKHKDDGIAMKILGIILIGVSRSIPYALQVQASGLKTVEQQQVEKVLYSHLEQLLHISSTTVHVNGNVCIQSLALLSQVLNLSNDGDEQVQKYRELFYRCLYSILLFPLPFISSRTKVFLNVVYKTIKNDKSPTRVLAFIKRMLQTTATLTAQSSTAAVTVQASTLYMISQLMVIHPFIKNAVSVTHAPNEILKQDLMTKFQYEQYVEQQTKEAENATTTESDYAKQQKYKIIAAEPIEIENDGVKEQYYKITKQRFQTYDAYEGDPLYTHAETVGLYELLIPFCHYHPTLQLWAQRLLTCDPNDTDAVIQYGGDPMKDFTALAFLDNWIKKQPKQTDSKSLSAHQPKRLILDPVVDEYLQDANNQFIKAFEPLYNQSASKQKIEQLKRYRHETEEDFVDRIMEEELLKMTTEGEKRKRMAKSLEEMRKTQVDVDGGDLDFADDMIDYDDEDDDEDGEMGGRIAFEEDDDDEDDFDEADFESIPWDSITFDKNDDLDEITEDDEDDEADFEDFSDEEEEDPTLGKSKFTAKGVFDDDSDEEEEIKPKGKKATKPAATKQKQANTKKRQDIFADIDVDELGINDISEDEASDNDNAEDLREILDDDETIADLLEEASSKAHKHDEHVDKLLTDGHGKATKDNKKKPTNNNKNAKKSTTNNTNGPVGATKRKQPSVPFNNNNTKNKKAKH